MIFFLAIAPISSSSFTSFFFLLLLFFFAILDLLGILGYVMAIFFFAIFRYFGPDGLSQCLGRVRDYLHSMVLALRLSSQQIVFVSFFFVYVY